MSAPELLALLIAVLVLWIVLKLAKIAVKVIFFIITLIAIAGVLWFFLAR
jgi:hypothetical protein